MRYEIIIRCCNNYHFYFFVYAIDNVVVYSEKICLSNIYEKKRSKLCYGI